jgi:hypothetical protein
MTTSRRRLPIASAFAKTARLSLAAADLINSDPIQEF